MPRVIVQENNRKFVEDDLSSKFLFDNKTLGVFGGPLVESGFIELKMLRAMIHEASARMNCEKIFYYMHRREKLKFKCDSITEIISENSDSLSLILRKKEIPLYWWSIFSSAMVDLAILNIKPLVFSYSPLRDIEAMRNPYLARHGVNTVETIYEIYGKLGFYCIL
jgi:hypothetical protein